MKQTRVSIAAWLTSAALACALACSLGSFPALASQPGPQPGDVLLAQDDNDLDESNDLRGDHPYDVRDLEPAQPGDKTKGVAVDTTAAQLTKGIRWLGHASFLIQDGASGKNIYIDPFRLGKGLPPADLILVTHDHSDHLSPDDIALIAGKSTLVVSTAAAKGKLPKGLELRVVKPGDTLTVQGIRIDVVPAYNAKKQFHPKANGNVGFIIHAGDRTIYHAGDTDFIPEMKKLKVDVALVPIGGTYTMDAKEAAEAVNAMRPRVAVPMHYGTIVGSEADAESFKSMAKVPVVIFKPETPKPAKD
jgi:L-ascorbate metabolism protein UlaG (beta-lactamase superfamily)